MPVLYCAIARMLNYPVKLVPAKAHLFLRWEDEKESRNFEVTSRGLNSYPDYYYQKFPYLITDEEMQQGFFLKSLNENGEKAVFLDTRGNCLLSNNEPEKAMDCFKTAQMLDSKLPYLDRYIMYCQLGIIDKKLEMEKATLKASLSVPDYSSAPPEIKRKNREMVSNTFKSQIANLKRQKAMLNREIAAITAKDVITPYVHEDKKADIETGNADFFDIESEIEKDKILTKPKPRDTNIKLELNK